MVTQSSRLSRKLFGSKGCQWVKLTMLPSDHSKFICSFKSLRPIHSSSTSGVQQERRERTRRSALATSKGGRDSPRATWVGPDGHQEVLSSTPDQQRMSSPSPCLICLVMNSSSSMLWMLSRSPPPRRHAFLDSCQLRFSACRR